MCSDQNNSSIIKTIFSLLTTILANAIDDDGGRLLGARQHSGPIPPELREGDWSMGQQYGFMLVGEEVDAFWEIWATLRTFRSAEAMKDTELEREAWYTVCECLLQRDKCLSSDQELARVAGDLLKRISRPIDLFEFIFVLHDRVGIEQRIQVQGVTLDRLTRNRLVQWGLSEEQLNRFGFRQEEFSAAMVQEAGAASRMAEARALKRLEEALDTLRFVASFSRFLHEEQTLYPLSSECFSKRCVTPPAFGFSRTRRARTMPNVLPDITKEPFCAAAISLVASANCAPDTQEAIHRALKWYSRAVQAEDLDVKLVSLCVALEALLVKKKTNAKADDIALLYVALMVSVGEGFLDPRRVEDMFRLRGMLVHGHGIEIADRDRYGTSSYICREAVAAFARFASATPHKRREDLIEHLRRGSAGVRARQFLAEQQH
jgi:hypothetical protein